MNYDAVLERLECDEDVGPAIDVARWVGRARIAGAIVGALVIAAASSWTTLKVERSRKGSAPPVEARTFEGLSEDELLRSITAAAQTFPEGSDKIKAAAAWVLATVSPEDHRPARRPIVIQGLRIIGRSSRNDPDAEQFCRRALVHPDVRVRNAAAAFYPSVNPRFVESDQLRVLVERGLRAEDQ